MVDEEDYSNPLNKRTNEGVDSPLDMQFMKINPEAKSRGFPEIIRDIRLSHFNEGDARIVRILYMLQRILRGYTYIDEEERLDSKGKKHKIKVEKYIYSRTIDLVEFSAALTSNITVGIGGKGIASLNTTVDEHKYTGLDKSGGKSLIDRIRFNAHKEE